LIRSLSLVSLSTRHWGREGERKCRPSDNEDSFKDVLRRVAFSMEDQDSGRKSIQHVYQVDKKKDRKEKPGM
jgi:hypothetical protein